MDKMKTWDQVDQIIKVLNSGCEYLDFVDEKTLRAKVVVGEYAPILDETEVVVPDTQAPSRRLTRKEDSQHSLGSELALGTLTRNIARMTP